MSDINKLDAVILCGGLGKRLRSVVADAPKVLVKVNDRPFLDILIGHLKRQGISHIVFCTGYKADQIERYYRDNAQGLSFEFSREDRPLGTGGALKNARHFIRSNPFFVFNGDSFCGIDLNAFLDFHKSKLARASIAISQEAQGSDFGGIALDDSARVTGFREKEKGTAPRYVNAGIYCFNEDIFSFMPADEAFSLEYDFFPGLSGEGFYGFCVSQEFYDIGTPARYDKAREVLGGQERMHPSED